MKHLLACLALFAAPTAAQDRPAPFTLAPLPYPATALEPVIDAETMALHHDRHHQAYVDALNTALSKNPALAGRSLEQLLTQVGSAPAAVRNNAGGHWNHGFFWKTMARPGTGGPPPPRSPARSTRHSDRWTG